MVMKGDILCLTLWILVCSGAAQNQNSVTLKCPNDWMLVGAKCVKFYREKLSWERSFEVCRNDGAYLVAVHDIFQNEEIGRLSENTIDSYWIGAHRQQSVETSGSQYQWSNGDPWSIFRAFWADYQPNTEFGHCVYVSKVRSQHRWAFGTCEWQRSFVCEFQSCSKGNFRCGTGRCVKDAHVCDGVDDCGDGSDEQHCPNRCSFYLAESSGEFSSPNFPRSYRSLERCKWTIETPTGTNVKLQFTVFNTEKDRDEVVILGGAKTERKSYFLAQISGTLTTPYPEYTSPNNVLIIQFSSDALNPRQGFKAKWTTVTSVPKEVLKLRATKLRQILKSVNFPNPYLGNEENVWVITAPRQWEIVTLEIKVVDLAADDVLRIRDGATASDPLLVEYTELSTPDKYILSTGNQIYLYFRTSTAPNLKHKGFSLTYKYGCNLMYTDSAGHLFSPGYGVSNYANFHTCKYYVSVPTSQRITLIFDQKFDLEQNKDFLEVYEGQGEGVPVHGFGNDGYSGTVAPQPVNVNNGKMFVKFTTNSIINRVGFSAKYSVGCSHPVFNTNTVVLSHISSYDYSLKFNVTCKTGYVFNAEEFYTRNQDGQLVSLQHVEMECLYGGHWNVQRIPQCTRIYCGKPHQLENGFVISSSGVSYGDTVTYKCHDTHLSLGTEQVTCQADGAWSVLPTCQGRTCDSLGDVTSGRKVRVHGDGRTATSVVRFDCDPGYQLVGAPILLCRHTGQWTSGIPRCQKLSCPIPVIENGFIPTTEKFVVYGTSLRFECHTGFHAAEANLITCQANQTFDGVHLCQDLDECSDGGSRCQVNELCSNTFGSFKCSCMAGFQRDASNLCVDIDECAEKKADCNQICVNSMGSYHCQCHEGYSLYTNSEMPGTSGEIYHINHTCVKQTCPSIPAVANGYIGNIKKQYYYGDIVQLHCNIGFRLSSPNTVLKCLATGQWSAHVSVCQAVTCRFDPMPRVMNPPTLRTNSPIEYGGVLNMMCNVTGRGVFYKTRTCVFDPATQEYLLQGDTYECEDINCGYPNFPPGTRKPPLSHTFFGATFEFSCGQFYRRNGESVSGNQQVTCQADGHWSLATLRCSAMSCPDPGVPAGGELTSSSSFYTYLSTVEFRCHRPGYVLSDPSPLQCGQSEGGLELAWNKPVSTCVDVTPPDFASCPKDVTVHRYETLPFPLPVARDNSGLVSKVVVSPPYFSPFTPIVADMEVVLTATDSAVNEAKCVMNIHVLDEQQKPVLKCVHSMVVFADDTSHTFTFKPPQDLSGFVNVTFDPPSVLVKLNAIGRLFKIAMNAEDNNKNVASCTFEILVKAKKCHPRSLPDSLNTIKTCSAKTGNSGYVCKFSCSPEFYFYNDNQYVFETHCDEGGDWSQLNIPSCAARGPSSLTLTGSSVYNVAGVSTACQQAALSKLSQVLAGLNSTLTALCAGSTSVDKVYVVASSLTSSTDSDNSELTVSFSIMMDPFGLPSAEYDKCGTKVTSEFKQVSSSSSFSGLNTLAIGNCPSVSRFRSIMYGTTRCESSHHFRVQDNVCVMCAPGTYYSVDTDACIPCPEGSYSSHSGSFSCSLCPFGTWTEGTGSTQATHCKAECPDPLMSPTKFSPCSVCPESTYKSSSTQCSLCPFGRLAISTENPLLENCKASSCSYKVFSNHQLEGREIQSVSGLASCKRLCSETQNKHRQCYGFNFNSTSDLCYLFDRTGRVGQALGVNFYLKQCLAVAPEDCYCADQCPPGSVSFNGYQPNCRKCPVGYVTNRYGATVCLECPAGETTQAKGAMSCVSGCSPGPCRNSGTCIINKHLEECNCLPGFTGRYCESEINLCDSQPCYHGAMCTSSTYHYVCQCPTGTAGERCEVNVNDCVPGACSEFGLCVDHLSGFSCACIWPYSGNRCETSLHGLCAMFPCSNGAVCTPVGQHRTRCDCLPRFYGTYCENQIDMCDSSPCHNGGRCVSTAGGFDCVCLEGFTGDTCQSPLRTCAATDCGNSVKCVDDPITGLPRCLCNHGYSLGLYCQYEVQTQTTINSQSGPVLTNVQEKYCMQQVESGAVDTYVGFMYNVVEKSCTLITSRQRLESTRRDDCCRVYTKLCSHQADDFWTPWYNTHDPAVTGNDEETRHSLLTFGVEVCRRTLPLDVECREQNGISASFKNGSCSLSRLQCVSGVHTNGLTPCPDFKVRFKCSVTRVFDNKRCGLVPWCAEQAAPCGNGGTCEELAGGFRCHCRPGYAGQRCQHDVDDCLAQPCLNGAVCHDGVNTFTCSCLGGFTGDLCTVNVDDCEPNPCHGGGSSKCIDGANSYTCVCKAGYTGKDCSSVINECDSQPCLHGGVCEDYPGGFRCSCRPGWSGARCQMLIDKCNPSSCPSRAQCIPLVNDFTCRCDSHSFGPSCESIPSLCQVASPCVDPNACHVYNNTDARCTCPSGTAGDGCHLFIDNSCTNSLCQNGGTCKQTVDATVVCSCPTGITGRRCEERIAYCKNVNCPSPSTCVEGIGSHVCVCPLGKAAPDCSKDIDIDYDLCFQSSVNGGSAYLPYSIHAVWTDGFSLSMWVKFSATGSVGTFLSIYETRSPGFLFSLKKLLHINEKGLYSYFNDNEEFLPFLGTSARVNDGLWHSVAVSWQNNTGTLQLILDDDVHSKRVNHAAGKILSNEIWLSLGSHHLPSEPEHTLFVGCVSQVNAYSRFVDFSLEGRGLVSAPKTVFTNGGILRWNVFTTMGNTHNVKPSTAHHNSCPSGFTDPPACTRPIRNKSALRVISCPDNVLKESSTSKVEVTWSEPQFDGAVSVESNYKPGSLMTPGHHVVVYEAKDKNGNAITCTFTVYIAAAVCPDLSAPRGGGSKKCFQDRGVLPFSVCTVTCPSSSLTLVDSTPRYFTCGPSGVWSSPSPSGGQYPQSGGQYPRSGSQYPPCGRVVGSVRADVTVSVSYPTMSVNCAELESTMKQRVPGSLSTLDLCQSDGCSDTAVTVDCSSQPSSSLSVHINNASSAGRSGTHLLPIEEILTEAILDGDIFTYQLTNKITQPDPDSLDIQVVFRCDPGQVVVEKSCVECGPGTYLSSKTKQCENCPPASYQANFGAVSCEACPSGGTTQNVGAISTSDCKANCGPGNRINSMMSGCEKCPLGTYQPSANKTVCESCPPGMTTLNTGSTTSAQCVQMKNCSPGTFLDTESDACKPCAVGSYQPDSGQKTCLPCPPGSSTKNAQATKETECLIVCPAGSEDISGKCEACPVGFYKDTDGFLPCELCPSGFRTANSGATSSDDCNIVACPPGSYRQETNCEVCPVGQYQPDKWQDSCTPCPTGTTTLAQGSANVSQCIAICGDGMGYDPTTGSCEVCGIGFYRSKATDSPLCQPCPPDRISRQGAVDPKDCNIANCIKPGQYRDIGTNSCKDCPVGMYQNKKWSVQCKPCLVGFTTKIPGASSSNNCYRDCPSGQQVNELTNECVACNKGTYRNRRLTWTCQPCSPKYTTSGTGATDRAECNIALCNVGKGFNTNTKTCEPCPVGTYQNMENEHSCLPCQNNLTTVEVGATSLSDCISLCDTEKPKCPPNSVCTDMSASPGFQCECLLGYTDFPKCTHLCDDPDHCLHGGTCRRDTFPVCECTESYEGERCKIPKIVDVVRSDMIVGIVVGITVFILICILVFVGVITAHRKKRHSSYVSDNDNDTIKSSLAPSTRAGWSSSYLTTKLNTRHYPNTNDDPAIYIARPATEAGNDHTNDSFYTCTHTTS